MVRVSLRIDRKLLKEIDRLARRRGLSRSAFIREVLREYLIAARQETSSDEILPEYSLAGAKPNRYAAKVGKSVVTMTANGRVVIPRGLRVAFRMKTGMRFHVFALNGDVVLVRVRSPKRARRAGTARKHASGRERGRP
jgi:bifunctional DNA-binding transcriptional regulator/antitoxin component of YhaV-PrlF toxin-antitoxin module